MEAQLNPKKHNHPLKKVKSFGFLQVGLQAKTPKSEPWSAVIIPRFCYWINTSAWSPRLRAPHRKELAGEPWVKQSPDLYQPALPGLRGAQCVTRGWTWRTCPGCLSVCLCRAGWGGLAPAINILLVDLRWFGQGSFVAPSHSWELWEEFLEKPKCSPSPRSASWGTEGSTGPQLCKRLKRENYFLCHWWKLSL